MGLKKRDIFAAGLQVFEGVCRKCKKIVLEYAPKRDHPSNPYGSRCQHCGTIVWTDSRLGTLRKGWADYTDEEKKEALKSNEAYRVWQNKFKQEYYELLPPCPKCKWHEWAFYSEMKSYPCPHCGIDNPVEQREDRTSEHYGDDVWWFESEEK